jgi:hypothetical protein
MGKCQFSTSAMPTALQAAICPPRCHRAYHRQESTEPQNEADAENDKQRKAGDKQSDRQASVSRPYVLNFEIMAVRALSLSRIFHMPSQYIRYRNDARGAV